MFIQLTRRKTSFQYQQADLSALRQNIRGALCTNKDYDRTLAEGKGALDVVSIPGSDSKGVGKFAKELLGEDYKVRTSIGCRFKHAGQGFIDQSSRTEIIPALPTFMCISINVMKFTVGPTEAMAS